MIDFHVKINLYRQIDWNKVFMAILLDLPCNTEFS